MPQNHYFTTVAPRSDYYVAESDSATAWQEKPQGVSHYMPASKIGYDANDDGNIEGINNNIGETPNQQDIDWLTPLLLLRDTELGFNAQTNTFIQ